MQSGIDPDYFGTDALKHSAAVFPYTDYHSGTVYDLAASTSFVVEAAESDVLKRKPRDPKESFMNKRMNTGIISGGITLAITVLAVFLYSWFSGGDIAVSQTHAFIIWLFGHVCLAFHMRTNNVPLTKTGIFSSRAFNTWMAGVVAFLVIALNIPVLQQYLRLTNIGIIPILCLALIAVIATSWMEIRKLFRKNTNIDL